MARAQGARAQMALAFETVYGTVPASGYTRVPFASTSLGAQQPLLASELLGYGRDPLAPVKDAVTADGDVVVPIDAEAFGFWLKAAFGEPTASGSGPWTHEFRSGGWTLPSLSIETAMPEVPRRLMHPKKRTVGVRIPDHVFVQLLLAELGEPLLSSSLILPGETEPRTQSWEIKEELDHVVDVVVEAGDVLAEPTTVVDWSSGEPEVVRRGSGDPDRFS